MDKEIEELKNNFDENLDIIFYALDHFLELHALGQAQFVVEVNRFANKIKPIYEPLKRS